jgi:hypothetical protein
MSTAVVVRVLLLSATLLCTGCLSLVIPDHAVATTDDATVQLMLQRRDFLGSGFVRISGAPFDSDLDPGHLVTMYVSADAAAAYEGVTPDAESTLGPAFPVGGMVVRTSSDGAGNLQALTFMVKHEPGYFPEVGDFLFGVTDPSGAPASDDSGELWGKIAECASCHETRSAAGFLFGVAAAHR